MQNTLQVCRSPERQRVSIGHLPVELIILIFHGVDDSGRDWRPVAGSQFLTLASVNSPHSAIFPNALAMVCSAWRDMLSSVPSFWTQVVIAIDGNPTLIKGSLELSRPLPIDVLITPYMSKYDEVSGEGHRVEAVMHHLVPELHRCRSIRFNTIQASSLPPLRAFSGQALLLRAFELGCTPCDPWVPVKEERGGDMAVPIELMCPKLETLHLNGRNFCNVCPPHFASGPSLSHDLWLSHLPNLTSLAITDYRPGSENEGLSMAGVLCALQELPYLAHLVIENVEFDNIQSHDLYQLSSAFRRLELSDLTGGLYFFFSTVMLPERLGTLHITRCNIDGVQWGNVRCTELILTSIETGNDISQILDYCDVSELVVDGCPSFDDDLIYSLMGSTLPFPNEDVSAKFLRSLNIYGCDDFSMGALKEMCEWRERRAWEEAPWQSVDDIASTRFTVCTPITRVGVYRKPDLTPEDKEWLKSYNSRFRRS
ncbi:hypothetical protein PAXINDRAFT_8923 [Paxillus involutus ATCC 200175]|nr:hypothetical protein PAXINDRAFT_8923 [Paxillus involutus ATCC 200175]